MVDCFFIPVVFGNIMLRQMAISANRTISMFTFDGEVYSMVPEQNAIPLYGF